MVIRSAEFVKSGTRPEHYPREGLPEVAFAGRSNVGKSSLMNALMQRRSLVKVSGTPGRTQLLSWFRVNGELLLCDLPGYGFARVPTGVRAAWAPMVNNYLVKRDTLRAVVVLADVRRGFGDDDLELVASIAQLGRHCVLVATKCDKLTRNELYNRQAAIARELRVDAKSDIVWTSASTRAGLDDLWSRIGDLCGLERPTP
jgi:GTP-binding protein